MEYARIGFGRKQENREEQRGNKEGIKRGQRGGQRWYSDVRNANEMRMKFNAK